MRKLAAIVLFLALLIPSAWFAWRNRDMPQLGRSHDDAIQYTVAKSLAQGTGYRILNLPQMSFETKYPPMLVWLLSIPWLLNPRFPDNLPIATALEWAMIPPFLWLSWIWFRRLGLSKAWSWIGIAALAVCPYTVVFGASISTEVLFSAFLLASILCAASALERENGIAWALAAGVLAGFGYLTRTAGIVAVVSTPVVFLAWRKRREAVLFLAGMLPAIVAWTAWVSLHRIKSTDLVAIYNTDYIGFFLTDIHFRDLGVVAWKNLGHLLYGMGGLAFPLETDSFFLEIVRITVAVGIIRGLARRWKQRILHPYIALALITAAELIVWDFPPNLRLMYPLIPLFLTGLIWEAQQFIDLLRRTLVRPEPSQRAAGWVVGAMAIALVGASAWMTVSVLRMLPGLTRDNERVRDESVAAFRWIAQHSAPDARILSRNPVVYLYAERHTEGLYFLPIHWYRQDSEQLTPLRDLPDYASRRHLDYIYLHQSDYESMTPGSGEAARRTIETNSALRPAFKFGEGTVYELASPVVASSR